MGNDRILNAITPRNSCFLIFVFTAMGFAQGTEYDSGSRPHIGTISNTKSHLFLVYY